MNPTLAAHHASAARECEAAAKLLRDMGVNDMALRNLADADQHRAAAEAAMRPGTDPDKGPDVLLYALPRNGRSRFNCPRCGEPMEFQEAEPDVGIRHHSLQCKCGMWQRVRTIDPSDDC